MHIHYTFYELFGDQEFGALMLSLLLSQVHCMNENVITLCHKKYAANVVKVNCIKFMAKYDQLCEKGSYKLFQISKFGGSSLLMCLTYNCHAGTVYRSQVMECQIHAIGTATVQDTFLQIKRLLKFIKFMNVLLRNNYMKYTCSYYCNV